MALKKSQLYASLWKSCDELRGGMDASQYKDYVLTLLFVKYVSDRADADRTALISVRPGRGFADLVALKGKPEIGDGINKVIGRLAEANDLKGVIDQADFNDESKLGRGKAMRDRLSRLVAIFEGLNLRTNGAGGDDLLGDAYEYLMRHLATESGKSKGQFYTPAEVSRIMARIVGIGPKTTATHTIYDPTCGSGSLLLKAAAEAPKEISIYGQEMDNATWALARMNMILHGYATAELKQGNTLAEPGFVNGSGGLKVFDFAVANPPFSVKSWMSGLTPEHDPFHRFDYGVPPRTRGDYAFLLHLLKSLKSRGRGAIILPHGVLFRGNRESAIRRELVRRGFIKGIIGLPPNLFYGTGIPACIIVLDKNDANARRGVFMIDPSRGFRKDRNKNRLRAQDIHRIVDVFNQQIEQPRYSRMVPLAEIADSTNDFNLNLPRYLDSSGPDDLHDLEAHLNGGLPERDLDALSDYWDALPNLRSALVQKVPRRPGYWELRTKTKEVQTVITEHPDFASYRRRFDAVVDEWINEHKPRLCSLSVGDSPTETIERLSEDLLLRVHHLPLLDAYDLYQGLMDYWESTMADDVHLITVSGWVVAAQPRSPTQDRTGKAIESPDLSVGRAKYKMDLIAPSLLLKRFFSEERAALDELRQQQADAANQLRAFLKEHDSDDDPLTDLANDRGSIPPVAVRTRLRRLSRTADRSKVEKRLLESYLSLVDAEATIRKAATTAQRELDEQVLARYGALTEDDIKTLIVDDKWLPAVRANLREVLTKEISSLSTRLRTLHGRYAVSLQHMAHEARSLDSRVTQHYQSLALL